VANQKHLALIKQGIVAWNSWMNEHVDIIPNLRRASLKEANMSGAYLIGADLSYANLKNANLDEAYLNRANLKNANLSEAELNETHLQAADMSGARFIEANLSRADLRKADLSGVDLRGAFLIGTYLNGANLSKADLSGACLIEADLSEADLSGACLKGASLNGTNLSRANLRLADFTEANLCSAILVGTIALDATFTDCRIYGISAWDIQLEGARQSDLIITREGQPTITVDNLKVAQFIYLLLNNEEIRNVLTTITSKAVLILGRFSDERKEVLDGLRNELRRRDLLPMMFDFDPIRNRDFKETISALAHMARFIIADTTDAKAVAEELEHIVPHLPSVPVQLLLQKSAELYVMSESVMRLDWVLDAYLYQDINDLLSSLPNKIIKPAEQKAEELALELEVVRNKIKLHNQTLK